MSQLAGKKLKKNFFYMTCIVYLCMILLYHGYVSVRTNIQNLGFFAILERGPRAFQIGKISVVNRTIMSFCVRKKKLATIHIFAIKKLKEK